MHGNNNGSVILDVIELTCVRKKYFNLVPKINNHYLLII